MTLNTAERVEIIPIVILVDGTQGEQCFSARHGPAHARQFATIFDEVATGTFDHAGTDGPTAAQVLGIIHVGLITAEVFGDFQQGLGDLTAGAQGGGFFFQLLDDLLSATGEQVERLSLDPFCTMGVGLAVKGGSDLPEIFQRMDDVQDEDKTRQPRQHLFLERLGAICQCHAFADMLADPACHPFCQGADGLVFPLQGGKDLFVARSRAVSGWFTFFEEGFDDFFRCAGIGFKSIYRCGNRLSEEVDLVNLGDLSESLQEHGLAIDFYEQAIFTNKPLQLTGISKTGVVKGLSSVNLGLYM